MDTLTEHAEPAAAEGSAAGDRFVAATLIGLALVLALYQLVTAPFIPVLTAFMVLYGAVGMALWRTRPRWLLVIAGLLAIAYLIGAFPVFAEHLAHPESPWGFVTDSVLVAGLLMVVFGVAGGLRGATQGSRRPIAVAAGVLILVAVGTSIVASLAVDGDARQAGDVEVELVDWVFPDLVVPASASALWVDNRDPFHHTLVIEDAGVRVVLPASSSVRVDIDHLAPGAYAYLCDVPGHEQMRGELVLR